MNNERKIELQSLHMDFWQRKLTKPIISRVCNTTAKFEAAKDVHEYFDKKGRYPLEPYMMDPEKHQNEPAPKNSIITEKEDVFNVITPYVRVPYLPAIAGTRMIVDANAKTVWLEKSLDDDWNKQKNYGFAPNNDWLDKLLEFTTYLVKKYNSDYPVSLDFTGRGVGDMAAGLMGQENYYCCFYDCPEDMKKLFMMLADIHVKWAKSQLELIPEMDGGYCNQYGIWAPGTITRFQEDLACNISKELFYEFLYPCEMKIVEAIDYPVMHTHSGYHPLSEMALEMDGLKAIDVVLDPNATPITQLIHVWNKILEKKCLIISGKVTQKQLDMLVSRLNPCGLLLDVMLVDQKYVTT
jgi:hypothetical protein